MSMATTFVLTHSLGMPAILVETYVLAALGIRIFTHPKFHTGDCGCGAVYRNGCAKDQPYSIPFTRHILAVDYD